MVSSGGSQEDVTNTPSASVHLASRSPRRRELLASAGVKFTWGHPGIEDGQLVSGMASPGAWAMGLAYLKARAARVVGGEGARRARVVIGADTLVVKDGQLIGTPVDEGEARAILHRLRHGEHRVVTGVAMIDAALGRRELFFDSALVRVGTISDASIEDYLCTGAWAGKAGGYNLAERQSAGWPIESVGDPTTVMGLPMAILPKRLAAFLRAMDTDERGSNTMTT